MVETRRTGDRSNEPIRPDAGRRAVTGASPVGRAGDVTGPVHQKVPSIRQLASLLVNGILTLPRNYRRGMFLDILA